MGLEGEYNDGMKCSDDWHVFKILVLGEGWDFNEDVLRK